MMFRQTSLAHWPLLVAVMHAAAYAAPEAGIQLDTLLDAKRILVVGDAAAYPEDWVTSLFAALERQGTAANMVDLRLPGGTFAAVPQAARTEAIDAIMRLARPDAVLACAEESGGERLRAAADHAGAVSIELSRPSDGHLPQPAAAEDIAAFLPEVNARRDLLRAAYLSAAGLAPAGTPPGLPIAEAEARAAEITASIRLRRLELMGRLDKNGVWQMPFDWPRPPVVDPGPAPEAAAAVPADAIVLFNGTTLDQWHGGEHWIIADGIAIVNKGSIKTKQSFGDCQMHVEYRMPNPPAGKGQWRGNSGIFFMDLYEIQLLDSFPDGTDATLTNPHGQCGALYKLHPPAVNACRAPGAWQTIDILFTRPRFRTDGSLERHGRVTVLHNGVAIHIDTVIKGTKPWHGPPVAMPHADALPITIQDHECPVQFRSIWVRPFEQLQAQAIGVKPNTLSLRDGSAIQ